MQDLAALVREALAAIAASAEESDAPHCAARDVQTVKRDVAGAMCCTVLANGGTRIASGAVAQVEMRATRIHRLYDGTCAR